MKILGEELKYKRAVRDARIQAQKQREEERRLREELRELDDELDVDDVSLSLGSDSKEETSKKKRKSKELQPCDPSWLPLGPKYAKDFLDGPLSGPLEDVREEEEGDDNSDVSGWVSVACEASTSSTDEEEGDGNPGVSGSGGACEANTSPKSEEAPKRPKLADPQDIIDEVRHMTGLETIASHMVQVKGIVEAAGRHTGFDLTEKRFHTLFIGNPGTGKTRVAELYSEFLTPLGLVNAVTEMTTGASLVYNGISEVQFLLNYINENGIIVINDAHQLRPAQNATGRNTLDYILAEMERLKGQVIFVFTAHKGKDIESLLGQNTSLQRVLPFVVKFDDYDDHQPSRFSSKSSTKTLAKGKCASRRASGAPTCVSWLGASAAAAAAPRLVTRVRSKKR